AALAPVERPSAEPPDLAAALEAVEWAVNRSAPYAFDELPLGDRRVTLLEGLTSRLLAMGFEGQVMLETHVGDFCLGEGQEGLELAPGDLDAGACDQLGYAGAEAVDLGLRQSVAFANFMN